MRRVYSPQERCRIFGACCSIEIPLEECGGSARLSLSDKVKCLGGLGRELVAWRRCSVPIHREKRLERVKTIETKQEGGAERGSEMFAAQKRRDWRRRDSVVKLFVMVDRGTRTKASAILSRALAATRKVDGRCSAATTTMVEVYSPLTIHRTAF